MWIAHDFSDYALLDASGGNRLERWGGNILVRPDPQVIWQSPRSHPGWKKPDAVYTRHESGGGQWSKNKLPPAWDLHWRDLTFRVKPTGFKHTGLFPEQAVNWAAMQEIVQKRSRAGRPFTVLNLFAYTGGATVACAKAGAKVTHVDAARGMVAWAKENAALSGVEARWIVDDCAAFAAREGRRGNRYDGIILDPPSYGRGPNGQVWKIEDDLYPFLESIVPLLSDDASFVFLNSYTTGLAPSVLRILLELLVRARRGGYVEARELGLRIEKTETYLPCGATGRWIQS